MRDLMTTHSLICFSWFFVIKKKKCRWYSLVRHLFLSLETRQTRFSFALTEPEILLFFKNFRRKKTANSGCIVSEYHPDSREGSESGKVLRVYYDLMTSRGLSLFFWFLTIHESLGVFVVCFYSSFVLLNCIVLRVRKCSGLVCVINGRKSVLSSLLFVEKERWWRRGNTRKSLFLVMVFMMMMTEQLSVVDPLLPLPFLR